MGPAPLPPSFQVTLRENSYFEQILGSGPPGVKTPLGPPDQIPGSASALAGEPIQDYGQGAPNGKTKLTNRNHKFISGALKAWSHQARRNFYWLQCCVQFCQNGQKSANYEPRCVVGLSHPPPCWMKTIGGGGLIKLQPSPFWIKSTGTTEGRGG